MHSTAQSRRSRVRLSPDHLAALFAPNTDKGQVNTAPRSSRSQWRHRGRHAVEPVPTLAGLQPEMASTRHTQLRHLTHCEE